SRTVHYAAAGPVGGLAAYPCRFCVHSADVVFCRRFPIFRLGTERPPEEFTMTGQRFLGFCGCLVVVIGGLTIARASDAAPSESRQLVFRNSSGILRTITTDSILDLSNPFFQPIGS